MAVVIDDLREARPRRNRLPCLRPPVRNSGQQDGARYAPPVQGSRRGDVLEETVDRLPQAIGAAVDFGRRMGDVRSGFRGFARC